MPQQFRNAKSWITKRAAPDYTNQLDLFSEVVAETKAPAADSLARSSRTVTARQRPQQLGFGEWLPLPPEDKPRTPPAEPMPVPASANIDGGRDHSIAVRSNAASPLEGAPNTETSARADRPSGKVFDVEPEEKPSRDFRITRAHRIGQGSLHEKARDNIAAIRLVKNLEAENREATENEKAILSLYVGWGALPNIFALYPPDEWRGLARTIKELLTAPEFDSARASTPNAHYTSALVIEAIWSGLNRLGLGSGAQILEPAMGVGHFFGLMPESMEASHRTGVELDAITARIARKLYPDATIFGQGFEETPLPDDYFDAVVGNVPFG
jgi:hypothetical protein